MERKTSDAQMRAQKKYQTKTYDRITIMPKKTQCLVERIHQVSDLSVNAFCIQAIEEAISAAATEKLRKALSD